MVLLILFSLLGIAAVYFLLCDDLQNNPIFGIYRQGGKWYYVKYILFLAIFHIRRFKSNYLKITANDAQGTKSHTNIEEMEALQPLSNHSKAVDAVFFIGANEQGYYFTMGSERRPMGVVNGLFYLVMPGNEILCSPKIPDTVLFNAEKDAFGAEGISMTPIKAMQKWKLEYIGKMWYKSRPSEIVDVKFVGTFTSNMDFFDYNTDLSACAVSRSIAKEKWSKEYFEALKLAHQSHYEQFGEIKVDLQINEKMFSIKFDGFRDHSYGYKRDWSLMHRYAFHQLFFKDGHKIVIGIICQPCTASTLEAGYIYIPYNGGKNVAIDWCDFELFRLGENGVPPNDYAFRFQAEKKTYTVQIDVQCLSEHFVSSDWEARMVERFLKCTVNGVPGWGVSEFHYNNASGRPEKYSCHDPDWFKMTRH